MPLQEEKGAQYKFSNVRYFYKGLLLWLARVDSTLVVGLSTGVGSAA